MPKSTKSTPMPTPVPISDEEEENVRLKVREAAAYVDNLIATEMGLFPFDHHWQGINFALVGNDREIIKGSGYSQRNVWAHRTRYFRIFNRGKYGQAINAEIVVIIKGRLSREDLSTYGLQHRSLTENKDFYYSVPMTTSVDVHEIHIDNVSGLDVLLSGDLNETLLSVFRLAHSRYVESLKDVTD